MEICVRGAYYIGGRVKSQVTKVSNVKIPEEVVSVIPCKEEEKKTKRQKDKKEKDKKKKNT